MKKVITPVLILSIVFLLSSCFKENHSIRLKNESSSQVTNVKVNDTEIGQVSSGDASDYKSVHTGKFTFKATTSSGQTLSGSGTVSGLGQHKWTLLLDGSGEITFSEDK